MPIAPRLPLQMSTEGVSVNLWRETIIDRKFIQTLTEKQVTEETKAPSKVFISYSWDSEDHKERVLALANTLRSPWGIETDIDQYVRAKPPFTPPQGWDLWMEKKIEWAEFVLIVCTETYKRRFRGDEAPGTGRGSTWEGTIIRQHLYNNQLVSTKFIPVIFSSQDLTHVPIIFNGNDKYILEDEKSLRDLCYRLRKEPIVAIPEVATAKLQAPPAPKFFSPQKPKAEPPPVLLDITEIQDQTAAKREVEPQEPQQQSIKQQVAQKLEPIHRPSEPSIFSPSQDACSLTSPVLEIDSGALQKNLVNLQNQGTLEECREAITQTSQWLLQHPSESYVRNQLLKLVQSKAKVDQQRQIIEQTTLWLLANLEASNSYTLTEYLKLVTSQGTPEQGQSAVSLTLKWLEQVQQNDSYVRRNCLILAKDKATTETAQTLLNQTCLWLGENLEGCDSYIMTAYLRLATERGNIEQQQKAKEQAAISLERSDDSYVRTQYLKLLKNIG